MTFELGVEMDNKILGALGENIIISELLYRGWIPQNLNSIVDNSPNVDIVAIKDTTKINFQIKTAKLSQPDVRVGHGKKKQYLNAKAGPKADFLIMVRFENPKNYDVYIVPIEVAEKEIKRCYDLWLERPKLDGKVRSEKFPAHIYFRHNKNRPDESDYTTKWSQYLNAWDLIEPELQADSTD